MHCMEVLYKSLKHTVLLGSVVQTGYLQSLSVIGLSLWYDVIWLAHRYLDSRY